MALSVLENGRLSDVHLGLIQEDISRAWFERSAWIKSDKISPAPHKPEAYTWTKSVQYRGKHYEAVH